MLDREEVRGWAGPRRKRSDRFALGGKKADSSGHVLAAPSLETVPARSSQLLPASGMPSPSPLKLTAFVSPRQNWGPAGSVSSLLEKENMEKGSGSPSVRVGHKAKTGTALSDAYTPSTCVPPLTHTHKPYSLWIHSLAPTRGALLGPQGTQTRGRVSADRLSHPIMG